MSTATTTARDWPTPGPGEPDFVIRDPAEFTRTTVLASKGDLVARIAMHWHFIARDADDALEDALQRWRTARTEGC